MERFGRVVDEYVVVDGVVRSLIMVLRGESDDFAVAATTSPNVIGLSLSADFSLLAAGCLIGTSEGGKGG